MLIASELHADYVQVRFERGSERRFDLGADKSNRRVFCFEVPVSHAFGNAPWCAVKNMGPTIIGTANTARSKRAIQTRWPIMAFAI